MTLGVLAFVVALIVSIMLHEAGHFAFAKAFGMKATQFFLGFGPTLFSRQRGETEYGVKAIPAGGFVKIIGMTPLEEVDPVDRPRAFFNKPGWQRGIVLAAGSGTHLVLALVLSLVVLAGLGLPTTTTTVAEVSPCLTQTDPASCTSADPPSPAAAVGLRPGDRIVALDGEPVEEWSADLTERLRARDAGPVELVVERDGQPVTLRPDLVLAERPSLDEPGQTVSVPVLGVSPGREVRTLGVGEAVSRSVSGLGEGVVLTLKALIAIPAGVVELLSDEERDVDGLVGPVGAARVGGQAVEAGSVATFLLIVAGLNVSLAVFNLLPLLPLDGGHLAVLGFERARSGIARLRRRPDPGHVDLVKLMPAAYLVIAVFVGLSVLLLYADIVNPIANPFQ